MASKKIQMSIDDAIQWGTTDQLELVGGWLGATPDMPGGCETVARMSLGKDRRLISVDVLERLRRGANAATELLEALEMVVGELTIADTDSRSGAEIAEASRLILRVRGELQ